MNHEIRSLFRQIADLPPEKRQRSLAHVAPDLRGELESLLQFDRAGDEGLMECVSAEAQDMLRSAEPPEPRRCGPYRLIRRLGSGGMGAVYLAERADGEIQQQVALKLLGAGGHRPEWRSRFRNERQLLASLHHPSIVHVIDAGHTEDGWPYLAMEYVEGQPIDVYAAGLSLRDCLSLFLRVCEAVSHAHGRLIIHRDLKPSNILVDSSGQPKLVDFGIAKLMDDTGDRTQTVERLLTPNYASPEQLRAEPQTTATDIYSLGAVLRKLLAGHAPLPADLDHIVRKAMRAEPDERYVSVEALAGDIRAFLESRPVEAHSGNMWYYARKFLRRHWVPMAAAAAMIASLTAGLYTANRQLAVAERRFSRLHELSNKLLDLARRYDTDPKLQNDLVSVSIHYLEGLGKEVARDRQLGLEIGTAYLQIARIQGVPEWNQQGQYGAAEESLSKAERFADSVLHAERNNRLALWIVANVAHDRAVIAYAQRNAQRAMAYSPKAVEGFDRLARLGNLTHREINGATYIFGDLAEIHLYLHRFDEAAHYARLGIDFSRSTPSVPGPRAQAFNMLAGALMYSGDFRGALEASREASRLLEQLRREDPHPRYIAAIVCQTRCREGQILGEDGNVNLNRPREAAVAFEEAIAAAEEFARNDAHDYLLRLSVAMAGHYLGDIVRDSDPKRALDIYDHALMRIREVPGDVEARRIEAVLLAGSSYAARRLHREDDARERISAAFRLLGETGDYPVQAIQPGGEADVAVRALADDYAETAQPAKAVSIYEELLRRMASGANAQSDLVSAVRISRLYGSLAPLLRRVGRSAESAAMKRSKDELWRSWQQKAADNPFVTNQLRAALRPQGH